MEKAIKTPKAQSAKNAKAIINPTPAATKPAAERVKANIIEMLVARQQHFIYKAQAEAEKLSPKKAKQYRQKMRRQLENFYFKICLKKDGESRKQAITEFLAHYKAHYLLNDFSIASITDSRDADKRESYAQLLKAAQESLSK